MADIINMPQRRSNPFAELRRKQKAARLAAEQESVKEETVTLPAVQVSNTAEETSPFDRIRHLDNNGQEYWSARELQTVLGYDKWQNFSKVINKTKESFEAVGIDASDLLIETSKQVPRGSGAEPQTITDYRLTRRACYTIAVNADGAKPRVAEAKQYFVIRTRQAELISQEQQQVKLPKTPGEMLVTMGHALIETEQRIDKKISNLQQNFDIMKDIQTRSQDKIDRIDQDLEDLRQRVEQNSSVFSILTEERNYDPIAADGNITVAEMADILHERFGYDTGRDRLYNWLVDNDMIIRYKKKGFKATKRFEDLGWFETETETVSTPFSPTPVTRYKVWVTQKGKQGIAARFGVENKN